MPAANDKLFGRYAVNGQDFPAPITSWREQPIVNGVNGIPINSSYRQHVWQYSQLESVYAAYLYSLHAIQQTGNSQLDSLETDPYDASGANESYGTVGYTDIIIVELSERTRGMPMYDDVTIVFEVYVG